MDALLVAEAQRFVSRRMMRFVFGVVLVSALVTLVLRAVGVDRIESMSTLSLIRGMGIGVMPLFGVIVGASFVGAEWSDRTMETLLVWEPSRTRVFAAKFAVGGAMIFVAGGLIVALMALGHTLGTELAPILEPLMTSDAEVLRDAISPAGPSPPGAALRMGAFLGGAGVGLSAGLFSMAWAMVLRNTAGAIAVAYVYLTFLEGLIGQWCHRCRHWQFLSAAHVLISGPSANVSLARAAAILSIYAASTSLIAWASFRYRDIT